MEKQKTPSVYISYSWCNSGIADEVQKLLEEDNIDIKRDKKCILYRGDIFKFMDEIGQGEIVVIIVSDKYMHSPRCMYEMVKLCEAGNLEERLYPIVTADTKIYDDLEPINYLSHWESKVNTLHERASKVRPTSRVHSYDKLASYSKTCRYLPDFCEFISNHNNGSVEELRRTNYSIIIDSIEKRYCELLGKSGNAKLRFEKSTLDVPISGGEYEIKIDANVPFGFEPKDGTPQRPIDRMSSEAYLHLFEPVKPISYSKEIIQNNCLKINISAASSLFMESACVYIYSGNGKCACLTINQEGDPTKPFEITNDGNSKLSSMRSNMIKTLSLMHTMEAIYTQCWNHSQWSSYYNHTLSPTDPQIKQLHDSYYLDAQVKKQYVEPYIKAAFSCMESLIYYQMEVLWGNVPYMILTENSYSSPIQMQSKELFPLFENDLLYCIKSFSSEKTSKTTVEGMIFPSKDVPRMILARMYMYNGEYAKALPLLQDIINSNNYSLEANRLTAVKKESRELIYSFSLENVVDNTFKNVIEANDVLPVITYAEVLLSTAECEYRLGNNSAAITYLNKVNQNRGLPSATTSNIITSLQATWKSELKGTGTYFAFLKRNGLAEQVLNIQSYRLLLPIPLNELLRNPNIAQNPGY